MGVNWGKVLSVWGGGWSAWLLMHLLVDLPPQSKEVLLVKCPPMCTCLHSMLIIYLQWPNYTVHAALVTHAELQSVDRLLKSTALGLRALSVADRMQ